MKVANFNIVAVVLKGRQPGLIALYSFRDQQDVVQEQSSYIRIRAQLQIQRYRETSKAGSPQGK